MFAAVHSQSVKIKTQWLSISKPDSQPGQGVVEYAGAIVMASFTLAMMMGLGPKLMAPLFSTLLTSLQSFFSSQLPT